MMVWFVKLLRVKNLKLARTRRLKKHNCKNSNATVFNNNDGNNVFDKVKEKK